MILYTESLYRNLSDRCKNAQRRILIASPFVGNADGIEIIIGTKWKDADIDCRVLTDAEAGFIKEDTCKRFRENNVPIRSLLSLHAKIYIVDDWCLITSANLTRTAFERRYEVGVECENQNLLATVELFEEWWKLAIPLDDIKEISVEQHSIVDYEMGRHWHFDKKVLLPRKPIKKNARQFSPEDSQSLDVCIKWYIESWERYHPKIDRHKEKKEIIKLLHSAESYKWEAFRLAQEDICKGIILETILNEDESESSTAACWNLLNGNNFFAIGVLRKLASNFQEDVLLLFQILYDEEEPLWERIETFKSQMDNLTQRAKSERPDLFNAETPGSMQVLRAISVYLSLRYPDKHYLYKADEYNAFLTKTGISSGKLPRLIKDKKYEVYERFCNGICNHIANNEELIDKCEETYGRNPYNLHLLVQDLMYVVVNRMPAKLDANSGRHSSADAEIVKSWLLPYNENKFRFMDWLKTHDYVFWTQKVKLTPGDIVYIYGSAPIRAIVCALQVDSIDYPEYSNSEEKQYWVSPDSLTASNKYAKLKVLAVPNNIEALSFDNLHEHGLKVPPQGGLKLRGDLKDYISSVFL